MTHALRVAAVWAPALLSAQNWATRPPRVISQPEPAYSEEARRAAVNAAVGLSFVVDENGVPRDLKVERGAGFGLDEQAVRTVETWRFEPGTKDGQSFAASTHVEVHFKLLDPHRTGQTARLNFSLASGGTRPELIEGRIPANPDDAGEASLRLRFTVGTDGAPVNFQTFETSNREWAARAIGEMAGWRFRPSMNGGQPEEVNGVFELTVKRPVAENRPTLNRAAAALSPLRVQDAALPAPQPVSPPDRAVFDGYPRRLICKWQASPGAVSYLVEWDYIDRDTWHAEAEGTGGTAFASNGTEATLDFVGAHPGRWRVWPVNDRGQRGNPSAWRTFRYSN